VKRPAVPQPAPACPTVKPVLRIRDILVRIRIRGSVPLTGTDPDPNPAPDPAIFVSELQDGNKNYFC
jgi:hypothetical protein